MSPRAYRRRPRPQKFRCLSLDLADHLACAVDSEKSPTGRGCGPQFRRLRPSRRPRGVFLGTQQQQDFLWLWCSCLVRVTGCEGANESSSCSLRFSKPPTTPPRRLTQWPALVSRSKSGPTRGGGEYSEIYSTRRMACHLPKGGIQSVFLNSFLECGKEGVRS